MQQHAAYCQALRRCGLELTELPADPEYPNSTFVEDTAILTPRGAILARPGAASREGEVQQMRRALAVFYDHGAEITRPGRWTAAISARRVSISSSAFRSALTKPGRSN